MNKAVIGILLLLISGLAGAFLYIRKLRTKSAESAKKLQAATSQVTSLQTSLKDQEASSAREAQELRKKAAESSEKLEEEKKAKKAELLRIAADRKAEKARRDALEKLKDAKIAELSEKQKRQEAEIAKTEERRQAALKEADDARAKARAARSEADRAIDAARRSRQLADRAKSVADQRARRAGIEISRAKSIVAQRARRAPKPKVIGDVKPTNIPKKVFKGWVEEPYLYNIRIWESKARKNTRREKKKNVKRTRARCQSDPRCLGYTCNAKGRLCWGATNLDKRIRRRGDRDFSFKKAFITVNTKPKPRRAAAGAAAVAASTAALARHYRAKNAARFRRISKRLARAGRRRFRRF